MPDFKRTKCLQRIRALIPCLAATLMLPAQANDFSMTEDDFFAPMPTVLSAARLVQPLDEAPVAMTVIDREMIEASSAVNIPELLRLVPGFQVTYIEGIDAISTYGGFADTFPRRMQILVDGRSVYTPGINGIFWAALPLTIDQIERIEAVRGPNAAAFGSNAFLGTINIITRDPETGDRLATRAMLGSENAREGELSFSEQFEHFAFDVSAQYGRSDGFPAKSDDNHSRILNFKGVYRPTLEDSLTFAAGHRTTDFASESFRVHRQRQYKTHFEQLTWEHMLAGDEDIRLQVYHNAFQSPDNATFLDSGLLVNVDYSLWTHRYDAELQHRWSPAADWRVSWGGGIRRDIVNGAGAFDTADDIIRDMARLFANVEWHARPDTVVNLGLMAERFSDVGRYFSPRLAVNWHVADNHTLRFSGARAYRMPTQFERQGELKVDVLITPAYPDKVEIRGTRDIPPERIHTFEIAYLYDSPAIDGSLDLRLFHNEVDSLIRDALDLDLLPHRPLRYMPTGTLRTTGIEAQARFRPTDDSLVHLAYAYTRAGGSHIVRIEAGGLPAVAGGNPAPNEPHVPRHTLTALATQRFAHDWQLSGTYYYVSGMEWLGEGDVVDHQTRVDTKLSRRIRGSSGDMEVSLNVQNLLDDPYWEFNPPNSSGTVNGNLSERRLYAQVKLTVR